MAKCCTGPSAADAVAAAQAAAADAEAAAAAAAGAVMDGDFSTDGIVVRTAAGVYNTRSIAGTANRITVSQADGDAGNPTLDVGSDVYVVGGTDVPITDGGTGASSASAARANLGILPPTTPLAEDDGLIGWAFDPVAINGTGIQITAGVLVLVRIPIRAATSITNVLLPVMAAGATLTSGQNFAALYQSNALLGMTADQTTNWQSTGMKIMALVGGPYAVTAGFIEVGFWSNGTTRPSIGRGEQTSGVVANFGATTRFATSAGSITTTPPNPLTIHTATLPYWAGVS